MKDLEKLQTGMTVATKNELISFIQGHHWKLLNIGKSNEKKLILLSFVRTMICLIAIAERSLMLFIETEFILYFRNRSGELFIIGGTISSSLYHFFAEEFDDAWSQL